MKTALIDNRWNRCASCGQRGFSDAELIPGWYITGTFVPMAGGIFSHCLECVLAPASMPVVDRALAAIETGRQRRRRREVQQEQ
jgi:hypothetical protein